MRRENLPVVLFNKLSMVEPYPKLVSGVEKMLLITAFFPGGKGLWMEDNTEICPNILVLGQDFSTLEDYKRMVRYESTDLGCPTWRELIKLFAEAHVNLNQCFFSNVFMGLRITDSMIGRFPGSKDKGFVKRNIEFLLCQLEVIKPPVIITLGRPASEMLSELSEDLKKDWKKGEALSLPNNGLKHGIRIGEQIHTCIALEHTSMRNSNVKRRRYTNEKGEFSGSMAEVEMLRDAIRDI